MKKLLKIDKTAAVNLVTELIAIPGGPGDEAKIAARIRQELIALGVSPRSIRFDKANQSTVLKSSTGNMVAYLPGLGKFRNAPRRMLSTHMDTVPLCVGAVPKRQSKTRITAAGNTGLGADNRSGCGSILTAVRELTEAAWDHPPLTLLFTVQEEVGLQGAQNLDASMLREPEVSINVDGGDPCEMVYAAIGGRQWRTTIHGIASHAGCHPEDGASAATIFAKAQARLTADGWHGQVKQGRNRGTANIGSVRGGAATNVVMDELVVTGECRSHSKPFLDRMMRTYERAFEDSAKQTKNAAGKCGHIEFEVTNAYPSFRMSKTHPSVKAVERALATLELTPRLRQIDGGLDANCLTGVHGTPAITIGAGAHDIHTVNEYLDIPEYLDACRVLLHVASGR